MDKEKKKLSLNKETVRSLDDQELKGIAGGTDSIFGCLTLPCTIWNTCACYTRTAACEIVKNENPIRIDDLCQQTLEDMGRKI